MEIKGQFRCMRCGHMFTAVYTKDGQPVERTCPKCRSNSIRWLKNGAPESAAPAKQG